MKRLWNLLLLLTEKDVRIELRSKEALLSTFLFVLLLLLIFNFSFGVNPLIIQRVAPGIIWAVIAFSGTVVISHLSDREHYDGVGDGIRMTGVSSVTVYFSKFLTSFLFLVLVEIVMLPVFMIFFNFQFGSWLVDFSTLLFLGTAGYAALGTLFSGLLGRERLKNLLLPVILFPALVPLLIAAVKGTAKTIAGEFPMEVFFLLGYDVIFLTASALLYDFVLEEPS